MENVDVLFLHGSPGAGKTTLARVIAEILRVADVAHGGPSRARTSPCAS